MSLSPFSQNETTLAATEAAEHKSSDKTTENGKDLSASFIADFIALRKSLNTILIAGIEGFEPAEITSDSIDEYAQFVIKNQLNKTERLLILLSAAQILDPDLISELQSDKNLFRLVQCEESGQLLPSGETFLHLLCQDNPEKRLETLKYLSTHHLFYKKSVIDLGPVRESLHYHYGVLKLTHNYRDLFLYNENNPPRFSAEFPAHLLQTHLEWEDLVINSATNERLEEIIAYLKMEEELRNDWKLNKHMKNGYRCLFYGPSGTGKTLAATLIGKHLRRDVYRVDLSSVVSKYVGETSKNLNALFNTAENKDWILFFDEGDALFGKRVDTSAAEDKNAHFANQDVAFLLQRIENYNGLVIVASNFKQNMDAAFSRRFQRVVNFEALKSEMAVQYWLDNFPKEVSLSAGIDLNLIVKQYPFSQASIINVIIRVCLHAKRMGSTEIKLADLNRCLMDEHIK